MTIAVGIPIYLQRWAVEPRRDKNIAAWAVGFVGLVVVIYAIQAAAFVGVNIHMSERTARILHRRMLGGLLSAPLRFFHDHSRGLIFNRFSSDTLDLESQYRTVAWLSWINAFWVGVTVVVAAVSEPWTLMASAFAIALTLALRRPYLRMSVQLRKLARAGMTPVYTHVDVLAQPEGLKTTRAFARPAAVTARLTRALDDANRAYLAGRLGGEVAFALIVSLVATSIVTTLVFVAVSRTDASASPFLALSIVSAASVATAIKEWVYALSILEVESVSVSRMLYMGALEREEPGVDATRAIEAGAKNWLREGGMCALPLLESVD